MGQRIIISENEKKEIRQLYEQLYGQGMLPNPKKTITVPLPIDRVSEIINNFLPILNSLKSGYTLTSKSDLYNQWTFEKLELLSLGVYIDISLEEVSENKTKIEIEVRRKIGSFDKSFEVQLANEHIGLILKAFELGTKPENLQKAIEKHKSSIAPDSIEGMGLTAKEWWDLGRPNLGKLYANGYTSYQQWVDAGKPALKSMIQIGKEEREKERAEKIARGEKPSFWSKLNRTFGM
jgi:hypothetical protein